MNEDPNTTNRLSELRKRISSWRKEKQRIVLVPTMGALHNGHLSLVDLAHGLGDKVIVSLFVNPKQFGANEDLDLYPRDIEGDLAALARHSVDLVYMPELDQIYPPGFATTISVSGISQGLCTDTRPDFFDGVATIVTKLFLHCQPDLAVFGEKDYQQLMVVRRLVRDLDLPIEVVGGPIVRADDGLALSSRNAYLSKRERASAPLLHKILAQTAQRLKEGLVMQKACSPGVHKLAKAGFELDYFELRDALNLTPLRQLDEMPARLLIAARLGDTRLIDNIAVMR
ncbi:MAG: pantoate--beta-alanine ligase [Hyphomicrobiaceae bacterium]|nr:pantoate--beta-alanine ligase [Hyphomicrobiaceae bacterium]